MTHTLEENLHQWINLLMKDRSTWLAVLIFSLGGNISYSAETFFFCGVGICHVNFILDMIYDDI